MNLIKLFHPLPAFFLFICFAMGITFCWHFGFYLSEMYILIVLALATLISIILYYKSNSSFFYAILILVFITGVVRMWISLYSFSTDEKNLFKNITAFKGTITDAVYHKDKSDSYVLESDSVKINGIFQSADGKISISQGKSNYNFKYGDYIEIAGQPDEFSLPGNPGEFNFRYYFQLKNIFFQLRLEKETEVKLLGSGRGNVFQHSIFNPIRVAIRKTIAQNLSEKSAAIVKALILGERNELESSIVADFQKSGVIHVLAISGLHVGFLALFAHFFFSILRIPKNVNMILIMIFLSFFVVLVNFKAPVLRASLMLSIYYLSKFVKRPQNNLNVLAIAGFIILLIQPEQLLLPGFQYSFAAVFGLLYGAQKLNRLFPYFRSDHWSKKFINIYIRNAFIASFSAIIATLPITWYYFGVLQTGALIANIFVIPMIGIVVFLSILLICISFINFLPIVGIAYLLDQLILFLVLAISEFAAFPFVQLLVGHPGLFTQIISIIFVFAVFNINKSYGKFTTAISLLIIILMFIPNSSNSNKLRVTFINVGQGDATLIEFPNGKNALIDAGDKNFAFDAGKRFIDPVLKNYGLTKVHYLIGSHPHSDHIGGFEYIMKNYPVDTLILNEFKIDSKLFARILNQAHKNNVVINFIDKGDMLTIDSRTRLYVLHPSELYEQSPSFAGKFVNNSSLVIKLVYGKNSILLNGDAEVEVEREMLKYASFLDCDILKVGHHGSKTSSSAQFLEMAKPEYAIISVGKNNKFKHPSTRTIKRLGAMGIQVLRTDYSGAVVWESDGVSFERINWR